MEIPGLTIRPATEKDLDAIYQITIAAFGPYTVTKLLEDRYGKIGGRSWQERKGGSTVEACRRHLDCVLIAEKAGEVVGYATHNRDAAVGSVGNNAVRPDQQGQGIGTALISAVIRRLRENGCPLLKVGTMEHDLPARRVYEKLGFREKGRITRLVRVRDGQVERASVPAEDADALTQREAEGFERIAISVYYEMPGATGNG